jgi:hypothetical protein
VVYPILKRAIPPPHHTTKMLVLHPKLQIAAENNEADNEYCEVDPVVVDKVINTALSYEPNEAFIKLKVLTPKNKMLISGYKIILILPLRIYFRNW